MRATLEGLEPMMTHDEIAKKLGVSRVRVKQLEKRALAKLKKAKGARELLDALFDRA
jgi:DNA-directed RNA polymerase sigma subunit (sigma70/sigma32)